MLYRVCCNHGSIHGDVCGHGQGQRQKQRRTQWQKDMAIVYCSKATGKIIGGLTGKNETKVVLASSAAAALFSFEFSVEAA